MLRISWKTPSPEPSTKAHENNTPCGAQYHSCMHQCLLPLAEAAAACMDADSTCTRPIEEHGLVHIPPEPTTRPLWPGPSLTTSATAVRKPAAPHTPATPPAVCTGLCCRQQEVLSMGIKHTKDAQTTARWSVASKPPPSPGRTPLHMCQTPPVSCPDPVLSCTLTEKCHPTRTTILPTCTSTLLCVPPLRSICSGGGSGGGGRGGVALLETVETRQAGCAMLAHVHNSPWVGAQERGWVDLADEDTRNSMSAMRQNTHRGQPPEGRHRCLSWQTCVHCGCQDVAC